MLGFARKVIERFEESDVSLIQALLVVFAIIFARSFIEIFSDNGGQIVDHNHFFIHYPMFYFIALLSIILPLYFFTGEDMRKVSRVVLPFFMVIMVPPVADLLISDGANMNYLYGTPSEMVKSYLAFAGTPESSKASGGSTWGIQMEGVLVLALCSIYVYVKKRSLLRVLGCCFTVYTLVFLLGWLPQTTAFVSDFLFQTGEFIKILNQYTFGIMRPASNKMALLLAPFTAVLVFLWGFLCDREKFTTLLRNVRPVRLGHYISMMALGVVIGYLTFPQAFNWTPPFPYLVFFSMLASAALSWMTQVNVNDIFDVEADKITNRRRPLPSGSLNRRDFATFTAIYFFFSVFLARIVSYPFFLVVIVSHAVATLYSMPPVRLKQYPILSKMVIGLISLIAVFAGFVGVSPPQNLQGFPITAALFILFGFGLSSHVIDLKDYESDKSGGVLSLPVLMGVENSKRVISIFVALTFLASPFVFNNTLLLIPALACAIFNIYAINRGDFNEILVFASYLGYSLIVLASLLTHGL
ncbi:MAG TPA: hypothetical protein ENN13_02975 [Candidatus Altiarchaeales archaeon]|nr:hypothetical protein [Candidatus Altiarchaeales archaeon]